MKTPVKEPAYQVDPAELERQKAVIAERCAVVAQRERVAPIGSPRDTARYPGTSVPFVGTI
jgi:hypothetical protein